MESLRVTDNQSKSVQKTPNRVSLDSILEKIETEEYLNPSCLPSMTICIIKMHNGFIVTGESAPADPENYDADLEKKYAKENAVRKIWGLNGYLLREKLSSTKGL